MMRIIAVGNSKGGVGKTTTVANDDTLAFHTKLAQARMEAAEDRLRVKMKVASIRMEFFARYGFILKGRT